MKRRIESTYGFKIYKDLYIYIMTPFKYEVFDQENLHKIHLNMKKTGLCWGAFHN